MKAIRYTEFGPPEVLQLAEIEKPIPKDNEVLIKVYATTVTSGDYRARNLDFSTRIMALLFGFNMGLRQPKNPRLGSELAGEVEAVGKDVTLFKVGDQVFGIIGDEMGANAEYVCMPEDGALAIKPDSVSYEEAAAIPFGFHTALHFLRDKADIQEGQKVLIYGASGSVGSAAVQLAKYYGAEITAVCSTANIEMVNAVGADKVIDYTKEDFTKSGESYDIVFETVGKSSFADGKDLVKEGGVYLGGNPSMGTMVRMGLTSATGGTKTVFGPAPERKEDIIFLGKLLEEGKLKAVIDRSYPLEETVEAHRYAEKGHKKGNVVLTVSHNGRG
ncbi:MAG: NAD(P)-dependent alcohol dehydrogenase [Kiloniellales bacterium]|nr:NAD(P)-dependent alcohol dehydrogenase [Kiloniellales bacterium]